MSVSYALTMPTGYYTKPGLNEFDEPCTSLYHDKLGILSDHDCRADAIYAAQAHADELADEASAEAAAAAGGAYEATLDSILALVTGFAVKGEPADDAARGEQRAVRAAIAAIQAIGNQPVAQVARAA